MNLYFETVPPLKAHWKNHAGATQVCTTAAAWEERKPNTTTCSHEWSKPSSDLHQATKNLVEAFKHSPCSQFNLKMPELLKSCCSHMGSMMLMFFKLWPPVNWHLQVKLRVHWQRSLVLKERTFDFTKVILFDLLTFSARARKRGLRCSTPFQFL